MAPRIKLGGKNEDGEKQKYHIRISSQGHIESVPREQKMQIKSAQESEGSNDAMKRVYSYGLTPQDQAEPAKEE